MAETEVENILREIRERVLSQERARQDVAGITARSAMTNSGNGGGDSPRGEGLDSGTSAAENLALINSYLTTTARAWDRLPPVVSNRSGISARLELWIKRHLKRATRWYAWEQVNFNAAVHHALRDLLPILSAYEQELQKLRTGVAERHVEVEYLAAELRAEIAGIHAQLETQRTVTDTHRAELQARLAELVSEIRVRDEKLQGQQTVCFKQLSLEASEAAVLEDRARRKTETLLEELRRRVGELEKQ